MGQPSSIIRSCAAATALGPTLEQTWAAILAGQFIRTHARIPLEPEARRPRAVQLALHVAGQVEYSGPHDALVVGTSKGPVESWLAPLPATSDNLNMAGGLHPAGLAQIASAVGERYRIGGPRLTLSAACASGLHALIYASMLIQADQARKVLVVGVESSLHPLFVGSFRRLGILAPEGSLCRPFDRNRCGFLMSEAAAAVSLESSEVFSQQSDAPIVAIDRYALAGDATHITSSDPDARTLKYLLRHVIDGREIDFIQAHGTATHQNDQQELAAIEESLGGSSSPHIYSHKAAVGHSLGASGLVSIAINWMCHQKRVIPANILTADPLHARTCMIARDSVRRSIRRSLVISAGFGGAMAAVALRNA